MTPALDPDRGGVQRVTCKLTAAFQERGHELHIFSSEATGHISLNYAHLHHPGVSDHTQGSKIKSLLKDCIKQVKPDVIINQMPYIRDFQNSFHELRTEAPMLNFFLIGCLHNSLFSVKNNLVDTMRKVLPAPIFGLANNVLGRSIYLQLHRIKNKAKLKEILKVHDLFVTLTPANINELEYFIPKFDRSKVDWIPNTVSKVHYSGTERDNILLHVGRINDGQKRSDLLLPLWKRICEQLPDWKFVIVGDGPYLKYLESAIEDENIPRIDLTGFKEPQVYYKRAKLFMMPSSFEGFPNTIIEAHSFGLPVFTFNSYPAVSWIVNDGQDSVLSPPYQIEHMARHIVDTARDSERYQKLKNGAWQNAERFTLNAVVENRWEAVFAKKLDQNEA